MARSIFGWSYPPGCSGPPDYSPECEICLGSPEADCLCEECPVCGDAGNPQCYVMLAADSFGHGMFLSPEQLWQAQDRRVTAYMVLTEDRLADEHYALMQKQAREDGQET